MTGEEVETSKERFDREMAGINAYCVQQKQGADDEEFADALDAGMAEDEIPAVPPEDEVTEEPTGNMFETELLSALNDSLNSTDAVLNHLTLERTKLIGNLISAAEAMKTLYEKIAAELAEDINDLKRCQNELHHTNKQIVERVKGLRNSLQQSRDAQAEGE